jgi:hypothetical protein
VSSLGKIIMTSSLLLRLSLCLATFAAVAGAQSTTAPSATAPATQAAGPNVEKLTLYPSAASATRGDFRLLPDLIDQTPGDAVPMYLMARRFWPDQKTTNEILYPENHKYDYLDTPIDQFPKPYAQRLLAGYAQTLAYGDAGARRRAVAWDLEINSPAIVYPGTYLNDLRHVINLLSFRVMYEESQRDWNAAHYSMQTQFSIGHQVATDPTVVRALVASGFLEISMYRGVSEWISRQGSANLYWPLTDLPRPFVDLRAIPQNDAIEQRRWDPQLDLAMRGQLPAQQWPAVLHDMVGRIHEYNRLPQKVDAAEVDRKVKSLVEAAAPRAKPWLTAHGIAREQVEAMSAEQAVGMYWCQEYKAASDELWKSWTLPYWEAHEQMMRSWQAMNADHPPLAQNPLVDAYLVSEDGNSHRRSVPTVLYIRYQLTRSDQYVALMRTIEALRDYAAAHDGHPPQNLDQITLPLPANPLTGKPFEYHVNGQSATIDAPSPAWRGPRSGWHYELVFAK